VTRIIIVKTSCFNCRWTCEGDNACLRFRVTHLTLPASLNVLPIKTNKLDKTISILSGDDMSQCATERLQRIFRPDLEYIQDFRKLRCPFCLIPIQLTKFDCKEYPF